MSKSEKQLNLPTFLLDRNINGRMLKRCFDGEQWKKKSQAELGFSKEAPDADLIRAAGKNRMVFLTADWNIQRQPENVKAAIEAKTRIVFVPNHSHPKDLFSMLWLAKTDLSQMLENCEGAVFINIAYKVRGIAALAPIQPGDERAGVVRASFGHRKAKALQVGRRKKHIRTGDNTDQRKLSLFESAE